MKALDEGSTSTRRVGTAAWWLITHELLTSTNDEARELPAWTAITAARQSAGRGRLARSFVSDAGGLWISAVLPAEGGMLRWTGFSLVVGRYLLKWLQALGVEGARLRWPNDLMIGSRKLGGLLIEQGQPGTFIVGLGMNVSNTPWLQDQGLAETATRLADHLEAELDLDELAVQVLDVIANAHADMQINGLQRTINALNLDWEKGSMVEITRNGSASLRGWFTGLDLEGNLRVVEADGNPLIVEHHLVERLVEI